MTLPQSFYRRSALVVARDLLGTLLVHRTSAGTVVGRIVETEAYLGVKDPASHAYRGQTNRNRAMFGPPGRAYIYFTYGMHYCFNIVCRDHGIAAAVLIRALEPVRGLPLMHKRRRVNDVHQLTNGPAKLVSAMGITKEYYDQPVYRGPLTVQRPLGDRPKHISRGPRIGISRGQQFPYRFWLTDNSSVSQAR